MTYYPFPAILHASYDDSQTFGEATVSANENAIEFSGGFIPLLPLGSEATVNWVLGNKSLVQFSGTVYLSTGNFMRLVGVDARLVEAARALFAINVRFAATVSPAAPAGPLGQGRLPVQVLYLSSQFITLLARHDYDERQPLLLHAEVPYLTLASQPLTIRRKAPLRRNETLLLCDVHPSNNDNTIALSAFAARLEQI